jgi:hypothetical protein
MDDALPLLAPRARSARTTTNPTAIRATAAKTSVESVTEAMGAR